MTEKSLVSPAELLKQQLANLDKSLVPTGGNRVKIDPTGITAPDGTTGKSITVVMLTHELVNAYYSKPYDPGSISPPDCFAHGEVLDAMVPVDNAPDPQSTACSICPMNEFKSAPNGKGKACRNSRNIAVLPADPKLMADHPMWTISVPPTAIKFFEEYLRDLRDDHGTISAFVATKVTQDKKSTWAAPRFEFVEHLTNEMQSIAATRMVEARATVSRSPNYDDE